MSQIPLLPRLIRLRDAPAYLGMDRNRFNHEIRPHVIEIPIGNQGIAFDRLDLDAWVDEYKACSGRPAVVNTRSTRLWDAKKRQASLKEAKSGTLKSKSLDIAFEKALALSHSSRQSVISTGESWRRARKQVGIPQVRVHDLKHTFGRRLRAAGVSFEDRQDLLGHESGRVTTHYSAEELDKLIEAANKVCQRHGQGPSLTLLRTQRDKVTTSAIVNSHKIPTMGKLDEKLSSL